MNELIPEGFKELRVTDDFVGLIGPLWFKAEGEKLRVGLPLEPRHGNPMGWAHGGLLVTVADMVMGAGSGHATGIRWPHPTVSLSTEFVRGAKLGQWLEGTARIARRTVNFCFCSCDLVCGGEIVLVASGVFKVPDVDRIPEALRAKVMGRWARIGRELRRMPTKHSPACGKKAGVAFRRAPRESAHGSCHEARSHSIACNLSSERRSP